MRPIEVRITANTLKLAEEEIKHIVIDARDYEIRIPIDIM